MGLADLYVDPALGFSLGWAAWVRLQFSFIDIYHLCHLTQILIITTRSTTGALLSVSRVFHSTLFPDAPKR